MLKLFGNLKSKVTKYNVNQKYNEFIERYGGLDLDPNIFKDIKEVDKQMLNIEANFISKMATKTSVSDKKDN